MKSLQSNFNFHKIVPPKIHVIQIKGLFVNNVWETIIKIHGIYLYRGQVSFCTPASSDKRSKATAVPVLGHLRTINQHVHLKL